MAGFVLVGAASIAIGMYKLLQRPGVVPHFKKELESSSTEEELTNKLTALLLGAGAVEVAREWASDDGGKGDVVIRLHGEHLVIECKIRPTTSGHTSREARRQARRDVMVQSEKYAAAWKRMHPDHNVVACICTNLDGLLTLDEAKRQREDRDE